MCIYIISQEIFYQSENLSMDVPSKSQVTVVVARLQTIRLFTFHCTDFSSCKTIYHNDKEGNILQQNFIYL